MIENQASANNIKVKTIATSRENMKTKVKPKITAYDLATSKVYPCQPKKSNIEIVIAKYVR